MAINSHETTTLPKHNNPSSGNAAHAPYNFVPLPDVVVKAVESAEELPGHDRYVNGRYTGHFEVTLTTKTPLYIRGMLTETEFIRQESKQYLDGEPIPDDSRKVDFRRLPKNKPDFFAIQENPLLPGSSLRGMLRNLIEIITYSKMQWVTDKPIIYRAVGDPTAVGNSYREKVMGKNKTTEPDMHYDYPVRHLKGGYLRKTAVGWVIQPAQEFMGESFVRVNYTDVERAIGGRGRQRVHDVYVAPVARSSSPRGRRGQGDLTLEVAVTNNVSISLASSLKPAKLIESGHMGGNHAKHWHCAIYKPDTTAVQIEIPDQLWQIYQEDRDLTRGDRTKTRKLTHDGDPLFYLLNAKNELVFFGPTVMFRLPYHEHALDLVPQALRTPNDVDFAEAMFGFVRTQDELKQMNPQPKQGSKGRAYAGRVFVGDGRYQPDQGSPWMSDAPDGIIEPHILASPKPTSFQLYLTQETPNNRKTLHHYDSNVDAGEQVTTLRGFKLYWPQGTKTANDLQATPKDDDDQRRAFETVNGRLQPKSNSTQHTRMRPVASGKKFCFQVHFENLTAVELGALQWALSKPNCHRLGMGKPLGMGVVQLEDVKLQVNDRSDRYKTLFGDGTSWNAGKPEEKQDFATDFETTFLQELRQHNVPVPSNFSDIERIEILVAMLAWHEKAPQADKKQYTTELGAFRSRPVLPDPLNLDGIDNSSRHPSHHSSNRPHQSKREQPSQQQQPRQAKQSPKPHPSTQSPKADLPEVREEVSDFAKLFMQKMDDKDKKKSTKKKK